MIAQKDVFLGLFLSVEDSQLIVLLFYELLEAKIEYKSICSMLNTKASQRTQIFTCSYVALYRLLPLALVRTELVYFLSFLLKYELGFAQLVERNCALVVFAF
jgi:hypothetical protein